MRRVSSSPPHTALQFGDLGESGNSVLTDLSWILGDVVVEPGVSVRERSLRVREDRCTVHIGESAERGVAIGA